MTGCNGSRFARKSARETSEQLVTQARAAADRGDATSAEYYLTAAVNSSPRDCEYRLELSELLMEHGSLTAATDHLRRVIEEHPSEPRGYVRLARALYAQGNGAEAAVLVGKTLELDPENPQAWLLRARIERDNHNDTAALAACYRVLAASAGDSEAQLLAADIHAGTGHTEQAMPLLRSLLENEHDCPVRRAAASRLLARCYASDGLWSDAASTLSASLRDLPGTADDWYQLAFAQFKSGELEAARVAVDRALQIAPANDEALMLSRAIRTASGVRSSLTADEQRSQASTHKVVAPTAAALGSGR